MGEIRGAIRVIAANKPNNAKAVNEAFILLMGYLRPILQGLSKRFYADARDRDDFEQLMRLRVFSACQTYDGKRNVGAFFYRVMRYECLDEIGRANQVRRGGEKKPISLSIPNDDPNRPDEPVTLMDLVVDPYDQFQDYDDAEALKALVKRLRRYGLSERERLVLWGFYCCPSAGKMLCYKDVAELLEKRFAIKLTAKQIDNTLSRIRRKAKNLMEEKAREEKESN